MFRIFFVYLIAILPFSTGEVSAEHYGGIEHLVANEVAYEVPIEEYPKKEVNYGWGSEMESVSSDFYKNRQAEIAFDSLRVIFFQDSYYEGRAATKDEEKYGVMDFMARTIIDKTKFLSKSSSGYSKLSSLLNNITGQEKFRKQDKYKDKYKYISNEVIKHQAIALAIMEKALKKDNSSVSSALGRAKKALGGIKVKPKVVDYFHSEASRQKAKLYRKSAMSSYRKLYNIEFNGDKLLHKQSAKYEVIINDKKFLNHNEMRVTPLDAYCFSELVKGIKYKTKSFKVKLVLSRGDNWDKAIKLELQKLPYNRVEIDNVSNESGELYSPERLKPWLLQSARKDNDVWLSIINDTYDPKFWDVVGNVRSVTFTSDKTNMTARELKLPDSLKTKFISVKVNSFSGLLKTKLPENLEYLKVESNEYTGTKEEFEAMIKSFLHNFLNKKKGFEIKIIGDISEDIKQFMKQTKRNKFDVDGEKFTVNFWGNDNSLSFSKK